MIIYSHWFPSFSGFTEEILELVPKDEDEAEAEDKGKSEETDGEKVSPVANAESEIVVD